MHENAHLLKKGIPREKTSEIGIRRVIDMRRVAVAQRGKGAAQHTNTQQVFDCGYGVLRVARIAITTQSKTSACKRKNPSVLCTSPDRAILIPKVRQHRIEHY